MTLEYRQVIRSETGLHRQKFAALPVIQPALELPAIDGDIAYLLELRDKILATPLEFMGIIRIGDLAAEQDMWNDWFHEDHWPTDQIGTQIADWKTENQARKAVSNE